MESMIRYMRRFVDFSEQEWEEILQHFSRLCLRKGEFFCRQGEVCPYIGFIKQGIVRSYYEIKAQEITRFILLEGVFVTALSSFIAQKPSRENIHALADTELWVIRHRDLQTLYQGFPSMQTLGRLITEHSHILLEQRLLSLLSFNGEERYRLLLREQPELVQRVPLQYIASLLGLKPETLSRIRARLAR